MTCEHRWVFQHTVYWRSDHPRPGSGAHDRVYGDRYYCDICLESVVRNERTHGCTYEKPIPGTLPK